MAASLIFYTNPMSRGQIARWAIEETGAAYDTVLLDYTSTMKQEPFLSVNPMGKVPAIVHDGRVVTECAAIFVVMIAPPMAPTGKSFTPCTEPLL